MKRRKRKSRRRRRRRRKERRIDNHERTKKWRTDTNEDMDGRRERKRNESGRKDWDS